MKKILLLLVIFSYSSFLYAGILTDLDKNKIPRYKGVLSELLKTEKNYNSAIDYMNKNKKELKYLKKELEKVEYRTYKPSSDDKNLMFLSTMNYMKLLTIEIINNLKTGNKVKTLESMEYQIKFFKIVLKKNTLITQMIVTANEIKLFQNLKVFFKNSEHKDIKRIIERYSLFRKDQFIKSLKGEFAYMNNELLKGMDLGKEFSFLKKEDSKKVIDYVIKKESIRVDKILLGFKKNKKDDYFKKLDEKGDRNELKFKVFRMYLIVGLSLAFRDVNKSYKVPKIYLETIAEILLNIGGVSALGYHGYYKKDKESLDLMKELIK